jgi:hypothetical protein
MKLCRVVSNILYITLKYAFKVRVHGSTYAQLQESCTIKLIILKLILLVKETDT